MITAVRNPYDWWAPWYHYTKMHDWFNPIARAAVNTGNESFSAMLQFIADSLKEGSESAAHVDRQIRTLEEDNNAIRNDFNMSMINRMRSHNCGILSWRYSFQLSGIPDNKLTALRQETLVNDLKLAMNNAGCNVNNYMFSGLPKVNKSARKDNYRDYYNKSSRDAVADIDSQIIQNFNYRF